MLRKTIDRHDPDLIISGVKIGQTDVSGMNSAQATEAVTKAVQTYSGQKLILKLTEDQQAEATLEELGISAADLESAV